MSALLVALQVAIQIVLSRLAIEFGCFRSVQSASLIESKTTRQKYALAQCTCAKSWQISNGSKKSASARNGALARPSGRAPHRTRHARDFDARPKQLRFTYGQKLRTLTRPLAPN